MPQHFKYHIVDRQGIRVESNIPDEYQAETVLQFLKDRNPTEEYSIEKEQFYIVKDGFGRDPDLHWQTCGGHINGTTRVMTVHIG